MSIPNDVEEVKDGLIDTFDGALDVGHDLTEIRGILSGSLGDLPFAVAIVVIVVFNFVYTLYGAFFVTFRGDVIESDCYCSNTDRVFYRCTAFGFTSVWILFLIGYAVYSTFFHNHVSRRDNELDKHSRELLKEYYKTKVKVCQKQKHYEERVVEIVAATVLNIDHYYEKKRKLDQLSNSNGKIQTPDKAQEPKEQVSQNQDSDDDRGTSQEIEEEENIQHQTSAASWHEFQSDKTPLVEGVEKNEDACRWNYFMALKIILLVVRFIFRLLIVPLLQFQWLSNYAWNCVMDGLARDYCETTTGQYFIGLDHSLVLYAVYVMILVTLTFSIIITWLPKGTPQLLLHYDYQKKSVIEYIDIKRKKIESR